jgi:hypothetical protein
VAYRRRLAALTAEDRSPAKGTARPKIYGYGYGYLRKLGSISHGGTLSDTIKRGIPLDDPIMAIAWGLARRNKRDLAVAVLKEFGYSTRYRVSHRTIKPIVATISQPGPKPK